MRISTLCAMLLCSMLSTFGKTFAQTVHPATANIVCTLADGKELSLRYNPASGNGKEKLPMGEARDARRFPDEFIHPSRPVSGQFRNPSRRLQRVHHSRQKGGDLDH